MLVRHIFMFFQPMIGVIAKFKLKRAKVDSDFVAEVVDT